MSANKPKAIWFLFTTMLSIFNICTIQIFAGLTWSFYAVTINALLSLGGLILQLHVEPKDQKRKALIPLHVILWVNSVSVFLMMGLSLFTLESQYHNFLRTDAKMTGPVDMEALHAASDDPVTLVETDDFYVFLVEDYNDIDFVAGDRPSRKDESIQLCIAAAFQASYEVGFRHDNVVGWHTSDEGLQQGTPLDGLGGFTYVDGVGHIWDTDESADAIKEASEKGGCGFQQFIVLCDGVHGSHTTGEFRCFRVVAVVDGEVLVIDSRTQMHYEEFVDALIDYGIKDAIYCDMGSGWNYSWYRSRSGRPLEIIGSPWPFSHNWLVFKK